MAASGVGALGAAIYKESSDFRKFVVEYFADRAYVHSFIHFIYCICSHCTISTHSVKPKH